MIAAINYCCLKYKRAYEREQQSTKQRPELDPELCFTTLVEYLASMAPHMVVRIQNLFEKENKTFREITTYLMAEQLRDPELQRLNTVYTATHNDYATSVNFVAGINGMPSAPVPQPPQRSQGRSDTNSRRGRGRPARGSTRSQTIDRLM
eukprot:GHVS01039580.1.p1 GENE.GHVS01039580.1~~GHVS01039580.1.p1  ORF type:complete len:150 (-),score=3.60 GHVS01039580.1:273-722(-)